MLCPSCRLENPPSARRCDCGHTFAEPALSSARRAVSDSGTGKGITRLLWLLPALGSLVGGAEFVLDWSSATGAPQQAVIAAMALAWTVIPYCFARAVIGVIRGE
jgi:hypothetical protein